MDFGEIPIFFLMISEIKIGETFPMSQFIICGFAAPFRFNWSDEGVGILAYIREDICLSCSKWLIFMTTLNF